MVVAANLEAVVSVKGTSQAKSELLGMAGAVDGAGASMLGLASGGLLIAGAAIAAVGVKSVKMAADYQQAMNSVQALTGSTTSQMKYFDGQLKSLAVNAGVAPTELSKGLYNVLSASFKGADAIKVLTLATEDAKIGMTDAATTTEALTRLLRSFGLSAKDAEVVNGQMIETTTLGQMTMAQYAGSVSKAATSTVKYHLSMAEMNASLSTLTANGMPSAAQAVTAYNQSLAVMYGNIGTVTASLHKNGIAFDEAKFNSLSYTDKIKMMNGVIQEAADKHVKITGVTLQAATSIQKISQHIGTYTEDLKKLSNQQEMAKRTQEAWATTQSGFNQQMSRAKAGLDVLFITIGQALLPVLTKITSSIMDKVMPVFQSFSDWMTTTGGPAIQKFADGAGKQLAQIFGDIGGVLSQLKGPLEQVGAAFKSLFSGKGDSPFASLHTSMKDIVPLIGATLPSVGMLIDLFKVLSSHSKEIGKWFQTSVLPALHQAAPGFKNLMDALVGLMPIIIDVSTSLHGSFQKALAAMLPVVMAAIPVIIKLAGIVAGGLGKAIRFLAPYVAQAAKAIGEFASEIMVRIAPGLTKFFTNLSKDVDKFMIGWNQAWHYLGPLLKGTWDQIVGIVKIAWAILKGIVLVGIDIMSGNWGQAWTDMKQMFQDIWDGMKDYFKGAIEVFIATIRPLLDALAKIPGPVGDMAKKVLSSFDSMSKGADKHTLLMKAVMLNRTAEMHTIAAAHLAKMKDDLIAKMKATSDETQKHALNMKIKTVSHLEDMQKQAAAKAKLMAKGVTDHAQGMSDDMVGHSIIPDMVKSIVSYFTALPGQAMSAVSGFAGQIGNFFTGLANDALTWGSKIVSNLISGIQSMAGNVAKAASDIAQQIADHFPHSPAKTGPLRNIPLWGPALVRMFSEDLRKHTPKARAAAEHMAKQLREAITITDANNPIHWGTGGKHTHRTGGGSGTSGNSSFAGSGTSAGGGYQFTSSMPNAPHLHVHPPAITLDGHLLTKHTMPHHVRHIREHTGHHH